MLAIITYGKEYFIMNGEENKNSELNKFVTEVNLNVLIDDFFNIYRNYGLLKNPLVHIVMIIFK